MAHDYIRSRQVADRQIRKWGKPAILRSSDGDRSIYIVEDFFTAREIDGNLIQRNDLRFLMSALNADGTVIDDEPDSETEVLILSNGDKLIFASPALPLKPSDIIVYWELHCRSE